MATSSARLILSLDLGTTGVRALLYSSSGRIRASAYTSFRQYYPQPGWVEHDADEIFDCILRMIRQASSKAKSPFSAIDAIGITNQRETVVLWDAKTGKPCAHAIVWQDRRTENFCTSLKKQGFEKTIRSKTGLVLDPYFSAAKIKWLLDKIPGLKRRANNGGIMAGTIDSWILWKLTGVHATDFTNASRTSLFNIHSKKWDKDLLKLFGIPAAILPKVMPSGGLFGETRAIGTGISAGIPVMAVLGDQQAALFGQQCVNSGEVKNTYGTGCFMMMNAGSKKPKSVKGILTTLASDEQGRPVYAFEGAVFIAGAAIQWLRDELQLIQTAEETEKLALSVKDTHGMTLIPAFAGLGSPYWRADVRGAMFGLTRGVTRAHLVRAALESIAHQSADVLAAMRKASRLPIRELRTDGKAALNGFLMQFQSDLTGLPVYAASQAEVTAWGAAKLAGKMTGFWKGNLSDSQVLKYKCYRPSLKPAAARKLRIAWQNQMDAFLRVK